MMKQHEACTYEILPYSLDLWKNSSRARPSCSFSKQKEEQYIKQRIYFKKGLGLALESYLLIFLSNLNSPSNYLTFTLSASSSSPSANVPLPPLKVLKGLWECCGCPTNRLTTSYHIELVDHSRIPHRGPPPITLLLSVKWTGVLS